MQLRKNKLTLHRKMCVYISKKSGNIRPHQTNYWDIT